MAAPTSSDHWSQHADTKNSKLASIIDGGKAKKKKKGVIPPALRPYLFKKKGITGFAGQRSAAPQPVTMTDRDRMMTHPAGM